MYHEQMISVAKIANGFLIEVRAPYKIKKSKKDDNKEVMLETSGRYAEEEFFAKDAAELGAKVVALIPLLEKDEYSSEDEFKAAFDNAVK